MEEKQQQQKPPLSNIVVQVQRNENQSEKSIKDRLEPLETNHKFIITLDGIEDKPARKPSPIIFEKTEVAVKKKANIPDYLPQVKPSFSIKNKEKCRYWPSCKQGEKCEFVHPSVQCKMFPQCKFGDKCLYIHPSCKFESSCTRKDCPYSHGKFYLTKI